MINRIILTFALSTLLISCSESEKDTTAVTQKETAQKSTPQVVRQEAAYLTEEYAVFRSKQVKDVDYKLSVNLSATESDFSGTVDILFDLLIDDQVLTVDFAEGKVHEVSLNDAPVPFEYNGFFISIRSDVLKAGKQQLKIKYSHPYSTTGAGLYRSIDPEDGRAYLYTDFEPYDANRLFPCFDQPDLKATYEVVVDAPKHWQVVTSVRESEVLEQGETRRWIFPQSARYSTYIFPLHAGEYFVWEFEAEGIPSRLMVRQSLAKYVEEETWFEATRQGFAFFQEYFDIEYPFVKYDQVIVPDFNFGAMENVAAVTFAERYIKRGGYSQEDRERIVNVLLHEMAHMWFGNLVTMRWWNGLWLNESFASYMSYLAMAEGTQYTQAWHRFNTRQKHWAYDTDEEVTNHPIELPVDNTDSAFANFDGITYGKGGSVLKQLSHLIGADAFRNGVSNYLKAKSYSNSELDDFISMLAQAANSNLDDWTREWLYKKGLNNISMDLQCEQGKIQSITLKQGTDDVPELRRHRLQLGLYSKDKLNKMKLSGQYPLTISTDTYTAEELAGRNCPDFVYVNDEDWAFIKVRLSDSDIGLLRENINGFESGLLRSMLWRNLWEGVRDARLPLTEYMHIVLNNIDEENIHYILLQVLGNADYALDYLHSFGPEFEKTAFQYSKQLEELAWRKVNDHKDQSDLQKIWFDYLVRFSHSDAGQERLVAIISEQSVIPGFDLDQDRRWSLLTQLSSIGYEGINTLLEQEAGRDPSDAGAKAHIAAQTAFPGLDNKMKWLQEIHNTETELPLARIKAAMSQLYPGYQNSIRKELLDDVLAPLGTLDKTMHQQYLRTYSSALIEGYCEAESSGLLQKAIDENPNATANVAKALKIALQEDRRCLDLKKLMISQK